MDYAAAAEALMRRRLLESIYDRMTDEEKRLFVQMTMQQKSIDEIMQALQHQSRQLDNIQKTQQTFGQDFASNLLGNVVWWGAEKILARLARLVG